MHDFLMQITKPMPMKIIVIEGQDYLERYFAYKKTDGTQYWLHRFLRSDSERHLHTHPWSATSKILHGCYTEEKIVGGIFISKKYNAGDHNIIEPETLHRIAAVEANTWTLMKVRPGRHNTWHFIDDEGQKTEMQTSPEDWWQECSPRLESDQ
jgi:hypothetical protein